MNPALTDCTFMICKMHIHTVHHQQSCHYETKSVQNLAKSFILPFKFLLLNKNTMRLQANSCSGVDEKSKYTFHSTAI